MFLDNFAKAIHGLSFYACHRYKVFQETGFLNIIDEFGSSEH